MPHDVIIIILGADGHARATVDGKEYCLLGGTLGELRNNIEAIGEALHDETNPKLSAKQKTFLDKCAKKIAKMNDEASKLL